MMSKFQVKITENKAGGEVFSYHLSTKRGMGNWSGMEVVNAEEMRAIAQLLIEKTNEMECQEWVKFRHIIDDKDCPECKKAFTEVYSSREMGK